MDDTDGRAVQPETDCSSPGVLIAASDAALRRALKTALSARLNLRVVGEADDCTDLCAALSRFQPELVLVDWSMPGLDATHPVVRCLSRLRTRVIALTSSDERDAEALALGVSACFRKSANPDDLIELVGQLIAAGKPANLHVSGEAE